MSDLASDFRIALRSLRRTPSFTVTAVLVLGLGIGMSVAMWTVFQAMLLRPIPVQNPERIVLPRALNQVGADLALTHHEVDELRHSVRTMKEISAIEHFGAYEIPKLDGDRPLLLRGTEVDGHFFRVLGAKPALGRLLGPQDDSTSYVMVLSYEAWQRYFGGDPSVLGRRFRQPQLSVMYSIVGVAPAGIDYPAGTDYWEPLAFPGVLDDIIGRLAPDASLASARNEFFALNTQIDHERPGSPHNVATADIRTFDTAVIGDVRPVLILLMGAVGLLLLIACVNVGNLLLLRAATRSHEFAVRRALGATYGDLLRQLLVETSLLALAGGVLGLLCAEMARRAILAAAPPALPRLDAIRLTGAPIGAAAALTLISMAVSGILPAVTAFRHNPALSLKLDTRSGSGGRDRRNIRQILVASQIALALILLSGAGLLARSLQQIEALDLGFRADHLSVIELSLPLDKYDRHMIALADEMDRRISAIPGVTAVTPIIIPPFYGPNFWAAVWQADWQSPSQASANPAIPVEVAGPDYFRTFATPILRGRGFLETDVLKSEGVAVVSQTVASRYWPGQDAIGKRLRFVGDSQFSWWTVVGVAGESRFRGLRDATPMVYLPYRQYYWQGSIALRTTTSVHALEPAIRRAIADYDPAVTLWTMRTVDDYLAGPLAQPRLSALLLSGFGLVALLLAAIGLYGIMASAVSEQTQELGVRMALGAAPGQLEREVLGRALAVSVAGAVVGLVCSLAAGRLIVSLLFRVSPTDPLALSSACLLLLVVALLAAYIPARRATRIDPARALRLD